MKIQSSPAQCMQERKPPKSGKESLKGLEVIFPGTHTGLGTVCISTSQPGEPQDSSAGRVYTYGLPSVVRKMNMHPKTQENTTHNEEKNQSIETNLELTWLLELADKHSETVIITVFHMIKKLSRDVEGI